MFSVPMFSHVFRVLLTALKEDLWRIVSAFDF
jgi:hypothetical protein